MFRKAAALICLIFTICNFISVPVSGLQLEQAHVNLPEMDVYVYEDTADISSLTASDIRARLGEEALTVDHFGRSEQGILYVYMLDISASMPKAHFDAAKGSVLAAYSRLREQDALILLTFGNEVTVRLSGGENRSQVQAVIDSLECKDTSTRFYEAMGKLVEIAQDAAYPRRIAVIVSDGIDDANAAMSQQELEEKLQKSGVAVSALCLDTSSAGDTERFAGFVHLTGGELYSFGPKDAEAVLDGLLNRLAQGWHLKLSAKTNLVPASEAVLSLDFGGLAEGAFSVDASRFMPDETPPKVKYAKYDEATGQIRVTFSEEVLGGEDLSHYGLTGKGGVAISLLSAAYEGDDLSAVVLTPADLGDIESFTLTVSGLTDISMEKNLLAAFSRTVYLHMTGEPAAETDADAQPKGQKPQRLIEPITLVIIGIIALAIIAAFVALLVLSSSKRRAIPDALTAAEKKAAKKRDKTVRGSSVFVFSDKEDEK